MKDNQAKYPQLRFKGFTDPWEQRKLIEVADYRNGKAHEKDISENGDYIVVNSKFVSTNGAVKKFSDELIAPLKKGELAFVLSDVPNGRAIARTFLIDEDNKYSLNQRIAGITPHSDTNSYFLHSLMNRHHYFLRFDDGAGQTNLSKKEVENWTELYPSIEEQDKIGSFFKQLDDTITLHQRKLAKLKELKQGYLQKLFPKNGSKFPQLRFAGFADAWEERKLSSISERVTRKNKNNESTLPLTISAQDGLVDQNDFFNKQVASRDVTGYFLVKNGEFAYNKSYSNGYPWGAIKRLDKYDMGVLSTLYIVFRPTKINSQFLVSYYDTTRWYREVSKNAAEGARNHGLLNIAPTDFFNTLLVVPKIVDEQQKIGSFFKQLDDTIALHQRKLEKLQELKKGYLQKMFC